MRNTILTLFIAAALSSFADGPADNIPEKVRPVPPPGAEISDAVRAELLGGADNLRGEIKKLREELSNKPNALALLPDIQIFERSSAVE